MKYITMFVLSGCPYCKRALGYQDELIEENPEYRGISIEIIDEEEQKELADSYDYYLVPTYYVNGQKLHEGAMEKAGVKAVLDAALS